LNWNINETGACLVQPLPPTPTPLWCRTSASPRPMKPLAAI
jgi:hypothetical protein